MRAYRKARTTKNFDFTDTGSQVSIKAPVDEDVVFLDFSWGTDQHLSDFTVAIKNRKDIHILIECLLQVLVSKAPKELSEYSVSDLAQEIAARQTEQE